MPAIAYLSKLLSQPVPAGVVAAGMTWKGVVQTGVPSASGLVYKLPEELSAMDAR